MVRSLLASAEKHPTHPAIRTKGSQITYAQLATLSDNIAAALHMVGFAARERATIFLPYSPQFITIYFGILKIGGIFNVINPYASPAQLQQQLTSYHAKTVFVGSDLYPALKSIQAQTQVARLIRCNCRAQFPPARETLLAAIKRANALQTNRLQVGDIDFYNFLKLGKKSGYPKSIKPFEDICGEHEPISYKFSQVVTMYNSIQNGETIEF